HHWISIVASCLSCPDSWILWTLRIGLERGIGTYCGGTISRTLKFLKSTSVVLSQRNVTTGPPHVIIWSGLPPQWSPSTPQPPASSFSSTFIQLPLLLASIQFSNFAPVMSPFP